MSPETTLSPSQDESSILYEIESKVRSEYKNSYDRLIANIKEVVKDPKKIEFYINLLTDKAKALDDGYFYGRTLYKLTEFGDFETVKKRVSIYIEKISECVELADNDVNMQSLEEKYFQEFNKQIPRDNFFEEIPRFMNSERELIEELKNNLSNCSSLEEFRRFIAEFAGNNSHNFGTALSGLRTYFMYDDPELY